MNDERLHDFLSCLNRLTDMLASLSGDVTPQEILDRIDEPLIHALGALDCAFALAPGHDDELAIVSSRAPLCMLDQPHAPIDWLPAGDAIRSVIASGSPGWFGAGERHGVLGCSSDVADDPQTYSVLVLPFSVQAPPPGVLALYLPSGQGTWRREVAAAAQTVARQVGLLLARGNEIKRRRTAHSLYQSIFDGISDGTLLLDASGRCRAANGAALELFQYSREELLAMEARELVVEADYGKAEQGRAAIENLERFTIQLRMRRKDGTVITVEASGYPLHYLGRPMCLMLFRDVLTGRNLETQLRHRLAQLESLYAMGLETTAELTTEDILERIVERTTTLVGGDFGGVFIYDEEQNALVMRVAQRLRGDYIGMRMSPGEGIAGRVFQTGQPMNVHRGSEDYARVNGLPGLGITSALVVPMSWGKRKIGVLAVAHTQEGHRFTKEDEYVVGLKANHAAVAITQAELFHELQRTAADLRQANLELQELDRMKDQLLAMVSHELRRPLSSARLNVELVQSSPRGLGAQERELLQSALNSIDAQTAMVEELLQAAQIGRLPASNQAPHDLRDLVLAAVSNMEISAREASLRLSCEVPDAPVMCLVNRGDLARALENLLSNAIKFTPQEGRVNVNLVTADQVASIAVQDTGIGIPARYQKRIFDKFFQVDNRASRAHDGIGLGLAIAKEIVEQHAGALRVESQPGRGSCFTIELPVLT